MNTIPQLQRRSVASWDGTYTFLRRIPFVHNLIFFHFVYNLEFKNPVHILIYFSFCVKELYTFQKKLKMCTK
jgi:hypothetical protein